MIGRTFTVPDTGHRFRVVAAARRRDRSVVFWIVENLTPVYDVKKLGRRWRRREIPEEFFDT